MRWRDVSILRDGCLVVNAVQELVQRDPIVLLQEMRQSAVVARRLACNRNTYNQSRSLESDSDGDYCPSSDTTMVIIIHNCARGRGERGKGLYCD